MSGRKTQVPALALSTDSHLTVCPWAYSSSPFLASVDLPERQGRNTCPHRVTMNKSNQLCNQGEKGFKSVPPVVRVALVTGVGYRSGARWHRAAWLSSGICWAPAGSSPGRQCWDPVMGRSEPVSRVSDAVVRSQAHRVSDVGISSWALWMPTWGKSALELTLKVLHGSKSPPPDFVLQAPSSLDP